MTLLEKVFRIPRDAVLEAKQGLLSTDDFRSQGFSLEEAKELGLKGQDFLLFVSAPVEFFLKNSEALKPYPEIDDPEEKALTVSAFKEKEKASRENLKDLKDAPASGE